MEARPDRNPAARAEAAVSGDQCEGLLLQSDDEYRVSEMLRSTFAEPSVGSPAFFDLPKPYVDLEQVASGIPTAPWAVYRKAGGGFLEVKYDALLQCVTTRDVTSYPVGGTRPAQARVFWVEEPKVHVSMETHSMYDRSVNRSRVLTKKNWTYIVPAAFAFAHFLWMVSGVTLGRGQGLAAWWVVRADIVTGIITRAMTALVAKYWNRGSWLQVALAVVSPMFWSLAYAGSKAIDMGWFWGLPLLTRVFSGLVCLTVNAYAATTKHKFLDVILVVVGFFAASFDLRILGHFCRRSKIIVYEIDFMFLAVYCHIYTMMTHLKMLGHGELPVVLVGLVTLATTESLCLLKAAYALEEAMEASSFVARMNKCARSSLLAGCAMLCDLRKGLKETLGEDECIRTYVTWVVRGTVPGVWQTANIMLPLSGCGTCRIEAKDVASCAAADDDGDTPSQVCCVLAFHGDEFSGDTCIGLQPALRDALQEAAVRFGLTLPRTLYEKGGTGYVRAVGAGIVGLPIV
ncbi:unnamed protein product [Laminaria digitata]